MPESSEGVLSETFPITAASTDEMETAVRQHSRFVYAVAYSVLRNHHDAEDAAQETFVRFWRHRRRWRLIRNRRAWLARTAWRVALDARKKGARDDSSISLSESAEVISQLRAAGTPADEIAARGEMTALLDRLSNHCRRSFATHVRFHLQRSSHRRKLPPSWAFRKAPSASECGRHGRF